MKIKETQWNLINEIALRIHSTACFTEMREDFLVFIQALLVFDRAVFYLQRSEDPYSDPVTVNLTDQDIAVYLEEYRDKDPLEPLKGIMIDSRSAIKTSEYAAITDIENTEYYRYVWEPKGIRYSLCVPLTSDRHWLGSIHLFRTKDQGDFNDTDVEIINILKEHLQIRMERELRSAGEQPTEKISATGELTGDCDLAKDYSLTIRECEVISMWYKGYSDVEICEKLFISKNTLKKHISNIYGKTGINNRIELFKLIPKK